MIEWIAERWCAVSDWVAMRAGELRTWLRASCYKAAVWLTLCFWGALGLLMDLVGRKRRKP